MTESKKNRALEHFFNNHIQTWHTFSFDRESLERFSKKKVLEYV